MVVRVPEHGSRAVEMEEMEEGMESPLDVLSRAATMVEAVNTSSARTPGRVEDISSSSTPGRVLETSTTSTPGREDTENSPPSQVLQFSFLKTKGLMTLFEEWHVSCSQRCSLNPHLSNDGEDINVFPFKKKC